MADAPFAHLDVVPSRNEIHSSLSETLEALLEFTGAKAGWISIPGWQGDNRPVAQCGEFAEVWLTLPTLANLLATPDAREVPVLLNDLTLEITPHLTSLVSCQLLRLGHPAGTVVLANKPGGFNSHHATVLQSSVFQLHRRLARLEKQAERALDILGSLTGKLPSQSASPAELCGSLASGLGKLLNHYLAVPLELAERAQEREDLPPEVNVWFEQILESCLPASRLLESLQELSATSLGESQPVLLNKLVHECATELGADAANLGFSLELEISSVELYVWGNPRMLRVVHRHLLSNAVQALIESGPRVITARLLGSEHEVLLEIEDTGEGLPVLQEALCYLPFFSTKGVFARTPHQAKCDGAGLGLTVCQHLLYLHGGHLELGRRSSAGTVASLRLPRLVGGNALEEIPISEPDSIRQDGAKAISEPHSLAQMKVSGIV